MSQVLCLHALLQQLDPGMHEGPEHTLQHGSQHWMQSDLQESLQALEEAHDVGLQVAGQGLQGLTGCGQGWQFTTAHGF